MSGHQSVTERMLNIRVSQEEPRDAAENFDTCPILQRHHAVSLPQHGFLVGPCLQTADNAGPLSKVSEELATEVAKNVVVDNPTVV